MERSTKQGIAIGAIALAVTVVLFVAIVKFGREHFACPATATATATATVETTTNAIGQWVEDHSNSHWAVWNYVGHKGDIIGTVTRWSDDAYYEARFRSSYCKFGRYQTLAAGQACVEELAAKE